MADKAVERMKPGAKAPTRKHMAAENEEKNMKKKNITFWKNETLEEKKESVLERVVLLCVPCKPSHPPPSTVVELTPRSVLWCSSVQLSVCCMREPTGIVPSQWR